MADKKKSKTVIRQDEECIIEGDIAGESLSGTGKITIKDKGYVEGEWKDGELCGRIKIVLEEGGSLDGEMLDGEFEGKIIFPEQDYKKTYIGKLDINSNFQGYGDLLLSCNNCNIRYKGEFKDDLPHGEGAIITDDGTVYAKFEHGIVNKDKKVIVVCDNGARYEGMVDKDGIPEGFGKHDFSKCSQNDKSYEGEWHKGAHHGFGKLTFTDGNIYIGNFVHGEFMGEGRLIYGSENHEFIGQFEGNSIIDSSEGILIDHKDGGNSYPVIYRNDKDGEFGRFYRRVAKKEITCEITVEGEKVGTLYDDNYTGFGEYTNEDGCHYKGYFKEGRPHGEENPAEIAFPDGRKYKGLFNSQTGELIQGELTNPDGSTHQVKKGWKGNR
jgi:hypothetical protein